MPKNLLIVESPAKAKTIQKYLGKDFTVKSSFGHVRDLEKGNNAVDIDRDFEPKYVVTPDKHKVVKELKESVRQVDEVWLATDEDREGEAISWHLCEVLGLDATHTKRIVFREITKPAIQEAVQHPRNVDLNLVNAQQARRVLDRLVGYELSEILWKKIKGKLSAGRVQSVAVKLIVEREREINQFDSTPFFKIDALFRVRNESGQLVALRAESPTRFETEADAEAFLKRCIGAGFRIEDIEVKPLRRSPAAPFTTSTLQQEASRKLGFSVQRTMSVAQRLYEAGHITYMRTDSTNLSETALRSIAAEIEKVYGNHYVKTRRYRSKSANAQEAHEAIRPTYIENQQVTANREEQRLYELIWKRTLACQMADAVLEKTTVRIGISTVKDVILKAEGEVLKFDGFLRVYLESTDDEEEDGGSKGILPPLQVGQPLNLDNMTATERYTRPSARYSEAGLVKKLEELGIGRPSTYAPTISKIMEEGRGYVVRDSRDGTERPFRVLTLHEGNISGKTDKELVGAVKNRLFPTDMGITVTDFLDQHFDQIMDYRFTADIEKQLDNIATGEKEWRRLLRDFYGPFHDTVEATIRTADRPTRERILGTDPKSGRTMLTRMARNGPVVQIGTPEELGEGEKPQYANLPPGQSIETISFEEALELFKLPRTLGRHNDEELIVGAGRFGPYVKYGEKFISIPRGEDPLSLTLERALEIVQAKLREEAPIASYQGHPVTKGTGRFGPFIKWKDLFVSVPRRYPLDTLTNEQIQELIEQKLNKEATRYIQQWEEENISIENGRWGPYIRFGKKNLKIPRVNGEKVTEESAKALSLEQVKSFIEAEIPDAFAKKKSTGGKKTAATKKSTAAGKAKTKK